MWKNTLAKLYLRFEIRKNTGGLGDSLSRGTTGFVAFAFHISPARVRFPQKGAIAPLLPPRPARLSPFANDSHRGIRLGSI